MTLDSIWSAITSALPQLVAALPVACIVVLIGFIANAVFKRAVTLLAGKIDLHTSQLLPVRKFGTWAISGFTTIVVLTVLGFQLGGVWTALTAILAMVAIGFIAVWSMASNTTATLLILIVRPFQIGDVIELQSENVKGRVVDLNFFFVTLEAEENTTYKIPNNLFFQKVIRRVQGTGGISLGEALARADSDAPPAPPVTPADKDLPMNSGRDPASYAPSSGRPAGR